jgi:hypothetical protein
MASYTKRVQISPGARVAVWRPVRIGIALFFFPFASVTVVTKVVSLALSCPIAYSFFVTAPSGNLVESVLSKTSLVVTVGAMLSTVVLNMVSLDLGSVMG